MTDLVANNIDGLDDDEANEIEIDKQPIEKESRLLFEESPVELMQVSSGSSEEVKSFYQCSFTLKKKAPTKALERDLKKLKRCETKVVREFDKTSKCLKIVLKAEDADALHRTKMQITKLLMCLRTRLPFTHLITVPFNNVQMQSEFLKLKEEVLTNFGQQRGVDEQLFQDPAKLHLTITILVLQNQDERLEASNVLNECFDKIVKPIVETEPINLEIKGLDVLKGNSRRAHVLYAKVEHKLLQKIADEIVDKFAAVGLLGTEQAPVKLHITLMNSLFRQRKAQVASGNRKLKREPFDATKILEQFKDVSIGSCTLQNIQLNDVRQKAEDGFYGKTHEIRWD